MFETSIKDKYLGGGNPTAMQNEVSVFQQNYYDRDAHIVVNHSVN